MSTIFKKKGNLDAMSVIDYQAFKYYRENLITFSYATLSTK